MISDTELLDRYIKHRSEAAFTELVQRYLRLVYSAAMRQCGGNAHLAEEIAQGVFLLLAKKAGTLRSHPVLAGWLHRATRLVALQTLKTEARRKQQELELGAETDMKPELSTAAMGQALHAVVDEVIADLDETDRQAILLRYFSDCTFGDIGHALRLNEDAARKRVQRALDKLHSALTKRGVVSTSAALSLALSNQFAMALPAGLASSIGAAALAGTSAVGVASVAGITHFFMNTLTLPVVVSTLIVAASSAAFVSQNRAKNHLTEQIATLSQSTALANSHSTTNAAASATGTEDKELTRLEKQISAVQTSQAEANRLASARSATSPNANGKPLRQLDRVPRPLTQVRPAYPYELAAKGVDGSAVISCTVDSHGSVSKVEVFSATEPAFGQAALDAVKQWRFDPGTKGGRAVNTAMQIPISFKLNQGSEVKGAVFEEGASWF